MAFPFTEWCLYPGCWAVPTAVYFCAAHSDYAMEHYMPGHLDFAIYIAEWPLIRRGLLAAKCDELALGSAGR